MPRVFLIRHGEAIHNVSGDHTVLDPILTPKGEAQALSLASLHPTFFSLLDPSTTLLVSSPFHRTLATTLLAFSDVLPTVPLLLLPQVQETGDEPCDTGADLESTREMFPEPWLDWSGCTEGWNSKTEFYAPQVEVQLERSRWVRRWIRERTEKIIVVVTHHGFLRAITKTPKVKGVICWPNAEVREYTFVDPTYEDEEADIMRVDAVL